MVLQIFESFPWMSSRSWECVLQTELHLTIRATLEGSIICILHVRDLRIRKMCNKSSWIWHLQMIHICLYCCWVTQSHLILQSHGLRHTRLPCPPFPGAHSNSCPLSWWCHPTIPFCPLLFLPLIFPSIRVFASESALRIRWPEYWSFSFNMSSSHEYSGLISFRMDWLDVCCPRDSKESSPTPQFKSSNSLALRLLYGPTLISVHNYWKNHSFDYMNLCWQMQSAKIVCYVMYCSHRWHLNHLCHVI